VPAFLFPPPPHRRTPLPLETNLWPTRRCRLRRVGRLQAPRLGRVAPQHYLALATNDPAGAPRRQNQSSAACSAAGPASDSPKISPASPARRATSSSGLSPSAPPSAASAASSPVSPTAPTASRPRFHGASISATASARHPHAALRIPLRLRPGHHAHLRNAPPRPAHRRPASASISPAISLPASWSNSSNPAKLRSSPSAPCSSRSLLGAALALFSVRRLPA